MNVKLKVLTVGALFFIGGQVVMAQQKKDSVKEKQIDEVVMVGFGQKKSIKENTGAVSTLKSSSIKDLPVASVDKAFMGRVAGVQTGSTSGQPGSATSVRVRGIASVSGGVSPVYVIDGVRISSGDLTRQNTTANILSNLNNNDIESVTVLKDAVSTALYGADSGAGVIIITTKSGKSGKAKFSFSNSYGVSSKAVDGPKAATRDQLLDLTAESLINYTPFVNAGYYSTKAEAYDAIVNPGYDLLGWANYVGNDTNWQKEVERKSPYQNEINFSVNGGSDKMKYYSSIGYFKQEGIVKNSDFGKVNGALKLDYKATDRLSISTDFQFSNSKMKSLPNGGYYSNPMLAQYFITPLDAAYAPDGSIYLGYQGGLDVSGLQNPVANLTYNYRKANTNRVFGNIQIGYNLAKGLNYKFVFAPEYINIEEDDYQSPIHGDGYPTGALTSSALRRFNFNVQNILEYSVSFAPKHNVVARLIQEAYKSNDRYVAASAQAVALNRFTTLDNFVKPTGATGNITTSSRSGYAAQLAYDYDKFLNLDLAYRRDAISNFLPGQKAGNFWSAGLALDFVRLEFLRNQEFLSLLKLRTSYGKLGNQISSSPYAVYTYGINYNNLPGLSYGGVENPALKWETVKPFNVGLDFGFFNNRIRATAEYYNKKTEDLIFSVPLSTSQGLTSQDQNVGSLVNKGFEFTLNVDILRAQSRDNVDLSFNANLSTLKNEMLKIYGDLPITTSTNYLGVGEAVNSWFLRKWAGVDPTNGDPLWYVNGVDGATTNNYNAAQQAVQGSRFNKIFGGAGFNLSYKGFSLDTQMEYGFGSKIFDSWANYLQNDGAYYAAGYNAYNTQTNYWTPTNVNAPNPKPIYGGNKNSNSASTRFLYKGDYLRLSNVRLSYDFNPELVKDAKLSGFQVFVVANNYWTHVFDKNFKFDPTTAVGGVTNLDLPIMKSLLFGFSANF